MSVKTEVKTENKQKPERTFSKAPLRRLMKAEGAKLVSEDAIDLLASTLVKRAKEITVEAKRIAESDKRKRIQGTDIEKATLHA